MAETETVQIDSDAINQLTNQLKQSYSARQSSKEVLEQIAVLTRKEENRKPLADTGLIKDLLENDGKSEDKETLNFVCRILGNLCFENEENRDRVLEAAGIPFLIRCLKTAEPSVVRCAAGAVANVVCEHENCQKASIEAGIVPLLLTSLEGSEESKSMVLRAITNLGENVASQKVLAEAGAVAKILALLGGPKFSDEIQAEAINALTTLSKHTESGIEIIKHGAKKLIELGSENDIAKHDITLVAGAFQFLMELSEINELKKPFLTYGYIPLMVDIIKTSPNSNVRRSFAKILSNLSTDDECMTSMFVNLDFYASILDSTEVEMQIMACMIIGNLARNDDHCRKIVETGVGKKLINRLENTEDPRVIQLALGAIRNTSLQVAENKEYFVNLGIYKLIQKFMKDGNHHTKFVSVGVIKSLVSGPANLMNEFLTSDPLNVQALLSVAEEDPSEGNERVQYEAARVLVILVQRSQEAVQQIIQDEEFTKPFAFLLKSPFDILILEGLKAFQVIGSTDEGKSKLSEKLEKFLESLLKLIESKSEVHALSALETLNLIASTEKGKAALQQQATVSEYLLKAQQSPHSKVQQFLSTSSLSSLIPAKS
eukprot:TRINITY_DN1622_c0_g1_i1.p1 TRINITY_DN1622_c0_g1~~TRINITY_DN1622_c0_g1_i1.p1  ORF type:complete len:602 (+),score=147.43 TRINITY_DN1622_c0_g1_i1:86-1891(+)